MHTHSRSITGPAVGGQSTRQPAAEAHKPQSPGGSDGQSCPNCGTHIETVDTSEAVCPDCSIVLTQEPLSTAPRPQYEGDTSKARTGSRVTLLYADRGLGTGVDQNATTDHSGSPLPETQRRLVRGKGWTTHLSSADVRLDYALGEIRRIGGDLCIPESELEHAARLYRRAHAEGVITGRSVDGFVAASLIVAVRQSSLRIPVSEREVESVTHAEREQIRTARGVLQVRMDVEIPPMDPHDFLPRATSLLAAPQQVERCAEQLLDAQTEDESESRSFSPRTLAAAALHAAYDLINCADRPPLSELSEVLDVSVSTISERKEVLLQYRKAIR